MKYDSFRAMDYEAAGIKTKLFEIDNLRTGLNPQIERVRQNIVKELHALESEKRRETVECWRDITRLKGELREVMREFGQEKRKAEMPDVHLSSTPATIAYGPYALGQVEYANTVKYPFDLRENAGTTAAGPDRTIQTLKKVYP
jgi:hypothetical protein